MAHFRNYENANERGVNWRIRDKITCLFEQDKAGKEIAISPTSAKRQLT